MSDIQYSRTKTKCPGSVKTCPQCSFKKHEVMKCHFQASKTRRRASVDTIHRQGFWCTEMLMTSRLLWLGWLFEESNSPSISEVDTQVSPQDPRYRRSIHRSKCWRWKVSKSWKFEILFPSHKQSGQQFLWVTAFEQNSRIFGKQDLCNDGPYQPCQK